MLFAVRSAAALHRVLDTLPVFEGDHRIRRRFTLAPGSDFGIDALAALEAVGARGVPWDVAVSESYDLIVAASPKGELDRLHGPIVLLPHGAGFNKTVRGDGADDSASGLDPAFLMRGDRPLAALHALAHPSQLARLADRCPPAAARAAVVGDPTLDRVLESQPLRDRYRAALGTGDRRLIVLASTWGPESLLARRPTLPEQLASQLPLDEYQLALVAHPNVHSSPGTFDLTERLPREVFLARPHEEWATLLVAADAVVTDHGSTALYAAALDRPMVAAYGGGGELLPSTPMAQLLAAVPRLRDPGQLGELLAAHRPGVCLEAGRAAFHVSVQGRALERLRAELYDRLGLTPVSPPPDPRLLPLPRRPVDGPAAFAVRTDVHDGLVRVERRPARTDVPSHHLAAEEDMVGTHHAQSAGLLYRRATGEGEDTNEGAAVAWTPEGWTAEALARYPNCRTAGVILGPERCLVRRRDSAETLLRVRIEPCEEQGRVFHPDPAAILSAVHALASGTSGTRELNCLIGQRTYRVHLAE
ncbi:CDP-glycerol glycerophosphotransferase family protein [Streptomyces sp. NPDC050704]|uniref:CDP-glycerol glycerophosphotransferase family protein n=1 Tax=Streptomyces sp. NPDC050704 TaxID=3157219 RepID=UPI0034437391